MATVAVQTATDIPDWPGRYDFVDQVLEQPGPRTSEHFMVGDGVSVSHSSDASALATCLHFNATCYWLLVRDATRAMCAYRLAALFPPCSPHAAALYVFDTEPTLTLASCRPRRSFASNARFLSSALEALGTFEVAPLTVARQLIEYDCRHCAGVRSYPTSRLWASRTFM